MIYNPAVLSRLLILILASAPLAAQITGAPAAAQPESKAPQVRVNYLNVCSPSDSDRKELDSVLARIPSRAAFGTDMEVSRGRSTVTANDLVLQGPQSAAPGAAPISKWVRIRWDYVDSSPLLNAQYAFSTTESHVSETLVWRFRDAKDVMQLSISDAVDSAADPAQVARLNTPADRIRVERFGKSSIVLARCPAVDQSQFASLFERAAGLMTAYRKSLGVSATVPGELARLAPARQKSTSSKPAPESQSGQAQSHR